MLRCSRWAGTLKQELVTAARGHGLNYISCSQGKTLSEAHSNFSQFCLEHIVSEPKLSSHGYKQSVSISSVVDSGKQPIIRFTALSSSTSGCVHDRCVLKRLGRGHGRVGRATDTASMSGDLVSRSVCPSHISFIDASGFSNSQAVSVPRCQQNSSSEIRQHHSLLLHQQVGRDKVSSTLPGSDRTVGVVLAGQGAIDISPHSTHWSMFFQITCSSKGVELSLQGSQHTFHNVGQICDRII